MKQQVFRKMSRAALLGSLVTPVVTIIPVQVGPPFSQVDIHKPLGKSFEEAPVFHKRNHRTQSKEGYQKTNPVGTTFDYHTPIRTKDDVIFANRVICTWNLLTRATIRRQHIFELIMQEALVHDYLEAFYDVMSDEEFSDFMALEKKTKRQCKDAIESYSQFVLNNMEVFVFGRLVPEIDVPDDKILFACELASAESHNKHQSSKNKKEKFSRYKRKARQKKNAERDFFLQDWIDDGSEDIEVTTLADVEEEAIARNREMSPVEKAYHDFVTDPCIEEAAWAIYHGNEAEHAPALAKAYHLLSKYQQAAMSED